MGQTDWWDKQDREDYLLNYSEEKHKLVQKGVKAHEKHVFDPETAHCSYYFWIKTYAVSQRASASS